MALFLTITILLVAIGVGLPYWVYKHSWGRWEDEREGLNKRISELTKALGIKISDAESFRIKAEQHIGDAEGLAHRCEDRSERLSGLAVEACSLLAHHHDPWWKMDETTRMCNLCRDSKVFEKMEALGLKFAGRSPDQNCSPVRSKSGLVPLPQLPYHVIEGSLKKVELTDGFVVVRMTGPSLPTLGIPMIAPDGSPKNEWLGQYTWALNSAFNAGAQATEKAD